MRAPLLGYLSLLLALGSGLIAGILFAFSAFIMRALETSPQGAATMQSINVVIVRSSFIPLFMGVALVSLVTLVYTWLGGSTPASPWFLAGALLYLVGVFGVTLVFNVPLNNRLAAASSETLPSIWANYLRVWTFWNTIRTGAGMASSLAFIVAFGKAG
jgi:uncharacterized membrane protein